MDDVLKLINSRLDRIENKLDGALKFKWIITGIVASVSTIFGVVITLMRVM